MRKSKLLWILVGGSVGSVGVGSVGAGIGIIFVYAIFRLLVVLGESGRVSGGFCTCGTCSIRGR